MNKFVCPNCGNISYTADTSQTQRCPQCTERHIIVNRDFMDLLKAYNSGNLKLTINRRQRDRRAKSIPVERDRRASERRRDNATPIGWLMIKHPPLAP